MMEKIISIIVPTYNMEKYLKNGLDSLIISERKERVEVIVVNDGSKDRSLEIAAEYVERYPSVFRLIDKPNGNYGSCINAALKIASGKYIKIMDADDHFITHNFEDFVNELSCVDADLVFSDYIKYYSKDNQEYYQFNIPPGTVLDAVHYYESNAFVEIQLPAITYRTEIFKSLGYHQTEGISYSDMEWCFTPMSQVQSFYYYKNPVYSYLLGRDGQTMDMNIQIGRFSHVLKSLTTILDAYSNLKVDEQMNEYLVKQILRHLLYVYRFYLVDHKDLDRTDLREFDNTLREKCLSAYEISGKFEYRNRIPYHYVAEWRSGENEYIPKRILLQEWIYDILGRAHVRINKFVTKEA